MTPPIDTPTEDLIFYKFGNFMEDVFEETRIKVNPLAPSRIGCLFLCPVLDSGFCKQPQAWEDRTHVYQVLFTGTIFTTSSEVWTEAGFGSRRYLGAGLDYWGDPQRMEAAKREIARWAESYWKGRDSYGMEESICEGIAIIEDLIYVKDGIV